MTSSTKAYYNLRSLINSMVFTALHGMQTRSSDENSVRPSLRPSVKRVDCDKSEKKLCLDFYIIRENIYPSFLRRRMVGGATPSAWNVGSRGPRWSEIADFEPIISRSASAVRPSEKSSINTNRKSTTRFPMSLRWSSYVAPNSPKGGLKSAKRTLSLWNHTSLKKVCYKVFLCVKTVSGEVVGHSLA